MRGNDDRAVEMFSYLSLEDRVAADHPLRIVKVLVDGILGELSPRFDAMYARGKGRPGIPPERLLRALLLQIFYSIRSERMLVEQIEYNLLFRWFVGLGMDERVWVPETFSVNRDRLLKAEVAHAFFASVVAAARSRALLSDEHFTVDGTLLEAWASHKSVRPRDEEPRAGGPSGRNPEVDFRGEKRSNETHRSISDPDARLARKGNTGARLCYSANAMTDNRHGLIVDTEVTHADGTAERECALLMISRLRRRKGRRTLGADKGYDTRDFVSGLRVYGVTPHVAQHTRGRRSAVDRRTTRHAGYQISQRRRKLIEQGFGWGKTVGLLRKLRHRGVEQVNWIFAFTAAAYNLVRMRTLILGGVCP
jgi:transposase